VCCPLSAIASPRLFLAPERRPSTAHNEPAPSPVDGEVPRGHRGLAALPGSRRPATAGGADYAGFAALETDWFRTRIAVTAIMPTRPAIRAARLL